MAVSDYNREKPLDVKSKTGTPTVSKAQPIYITSGDDSTTGTGQIVIDWTNVSAESDLAVYDENDSLLAYEIEDFDATAETALLWVWDSWVRDGSTQAKVVYGNGPASSEEGTAADVWGNTGQNAEVVWHLNDASGPVEDSTPNDRDGTVSGATLQDGGEFADEASFDGTDDKITDAVDPVGAYPVTLSMWVDLDSVDGWLGGIFDTGKNSKYFTIFSQTAIRYGIRPAVSAKSRTATRRHQRRGHMLK